jgi:transposase
MNSNQLFEMALSLEKPWYVKNIDMIKPLNGIEGQIDIYLDFEKGFKFPGGKTHDTVERTWQHLNFFQHKCFLHARVPRVKTEQGGTETVKVPWARSGSGFTLLFEAFSMLLIESEMPVSKVAQIMDVYPQRLWNVFTYWIEKAHQADDQSEVSVLGIDETSSKKGHNYVTVAVDMDQRKVLYAVPGKGADTIDAICKHLETKGCKKEQIKQTCIDMSPAFISGIQSNFENASITFDKFHVVQLINKAMDKVRMLERKEFAMLKGYKYTFLKNDRNLSEKAKEDKYNILTLLPSIANAYRLKELFAEFWTFDNKQEAGAYLSYWCDLAEDSKIYPFIKAANTLKAHWFGLVNYSETNLNNGILEGINSKIQLAKKRARGYRNINNFINMIYFIAGKLKFDYPLYARQS